jgi:hypothetical protein
MKLRMMRTAYTAATIASAVMVLAAPYKWR